MTATPDASKLINQLLHPFFQPTNPPSRWCMVLDSIISAHSGFGVRFIVGAGENKTKRRSSGDLE